METLTTAPLGIIASELRSEINASITYKVRALATHLKKTGDKSTINITAKLVPDKDIMLSSWAKLNTYNLHFGFEVGRPAAVRRPRFEAVESLMYLMPRKGDGEVVLAISLRDEDLERLRENEEFGKYATFIG